MNSKEALRQLRKHLCFNTEQEHHENLYFYEMIEKDLEALEIIKKKGVNVSLVLRCNTAKEYNKYFEIDFEKLTEEEFFILKEV